MVEKIENRMIFKSNLDYCEPMLSKHNLYPKKGGALKPNIKNKTYSELDLILWIMFLTDGNTSIDDIAFKLKCPVSDILNVSKKLNETKLLRHVI